MHFILFYLSRYRSLPTLETIMTAFGIQKVNGIAFEKLAAFLKDLGGHQESDTLHNLLEALALEQNLEKNEGSKVTEKIPPLSEEELLQKPFYTGEFCPQEGSCEIPVPK